MKVAVANRHWETAGGGETYAAAIATALAHRHEVTLLSDPGVDWDRLARRFHVDPTVFEIREVDQEDLAEIAAAARDYDLFVNTTHGTDLGCPTDHGLLVVHFPYRVDEGLGPFGRTAARWLARRGLVAPDDGVSFTEGWHLPESNGSMTWRWSKGTGKIKLSLPSDTRVPVRISFGPDRPEPTEVELVVDGQIVAETVVRPGEHTSVTVDLDGQVEGVPRVLDVRSESFVPRDQNHTQDVRELGVQVTDVQVDGGSPAARVRQTLRRFGPVRRASRVHFATTYDAVVCNSHFTRSWIRRWWGLDAEVAYPPVTRREPVDPKSPIILSVGRFFAKDRGHSKKQLEMVHAFRRLCDEGLDGWELHLVGGCQAIDRPYLDEVERAAEGLPVTIHVDAPAAELDELYARAAIYWQATGLGEDPEEAPEVQEHFGIAIIEAMSAGTVPVVHGTGGPAETVRHDVDGFHFRSIDELVSQTQMLIAEPKRYTRLADAARGRSAGFSSDALAGRLEHLLGALST